MTYNVFDGALNVTQPTTSTLLLSRKSNLGLFLKGSCGNKNEMSCGCTSPGIN